MRLGYNTNGFANHDAIQAIEILAEIGYASVAITVDHHCLSPFRGDRIEQQAAIKALLNRYKLTSVVESGARYLLDPRHKHQPTLLSGDSDQRRRRLDFLKYCCDVAQDFNADAVSLWSGCADPDVADEQNLEWLAEGLGELLPYAGSRGIPLAFEPEPGMFIDSMAAFDRLTQWIDADNLKLTIDVGHLYCQGEVPMVDYIQRYADRLINVHMEDMCAGVHEHLMFGEGEMHFPPLIDGLAEAGFQHGVHVELSRHSHVAPQAARQAYEFLKPLFPA